MTTWETMAMIVIEASVLIAIFVIVNEDSGP